VPALQPGHSVTGRDWTRTVGGPSRSAAHCKPQVTACRGGDVRGGDGAGESV